MSLPFELVEHYLRKNLYFHLGSQELQGLQKYFEYAARLGLIESVPNLLIDDCTIEG